MNLEIVIWHGEGDSLYYIVDKDSEDPPAVIETFHTLREAMLYLAKNLPGGRVIKTFGGPAGDITITAGPGDIYHD